MTLTSSTIQGGVTVPRGFRAVGTSAGIKANGGLDLALLVSDVPAQAAAVFTTNLAIWRRRARRHRQQRLRERVHRR